MRSAPGSSHCWENSPSTKPGAIHLGIGRAHARTKILCLVHNDNPSFRDEQLPGLIARIGLLVVDEAHCISDWGHDFRPDYRRLRDLIARMPAGVPVLATTATANSRVVADVAEQLDAATERNAAEQSPSPGALTIRGPLARASLRLGVLRLPDSAGRLAWLMSHLDKLPGSGIIYTLTVSAANDTARLLRERGHDMRAYTGQTDTDEREECETLLKDNRVKALVATSALGMGFDKPDLGFVVHLGAPSSPVSYYQQVGRAGRATDSADVLLLPGTEDREIWRHFATASMPDRDRAERVLAALADAGSPMSTPALEAVVDIRRTPLELLLKVLDVDGAVARVRGGWLATGEPWSYDNERYQRIAAERVAEQQHMIEYEETSGCRMEFLQRSLDDDTAAPCGRCVPLEPRRQWPTGGDRLGVPVKGRIAPDEQAGEGRALARLTDLGWGGVLRDIFAAGAGDAPVPPNVLAACVRVLAEWPWQNRPAAVVAMPSRARPHLSTRSRAASPRSAACPTSAHSNSSTAAPPDSPAATARSASRVSGAGSRRTASTFPRPRCCSSTTGSTAAGRSPSPPANSAARARPRYCPSPWRFAGDRLSERRQLHARQSPREETRPRHRHPATRPGRRTLE